MKLLNVEDIYPLTPVQEGLLFHALQAPGSGVYCTQLGCVIEGELNPSALRQAWQRVQQRHPVLRTAFLWDGLDRPVQVVHEQLPLPWMEEDWRALEPAEQERRWAELLDADWRHGFALGEAPLSRLTLVRVSARAYRMLWCYHHLLMDGWSTSLVLQEVQKLYHRCSDSGEDAVLQPVRPYRDYIAWLQDQPLLDAEAFWRHTMDGCPAPTRLPVPQRPAGAPLLAETHATQQLMLPAAVTEALQQCARRQRVSLNVIVQAAWAVLLGRYSGEDEVVFGVTLAGRPPDLAGVESMVGLFINSLPIRVRLAAEATVSELFNQVHTSLGALQEYQHSPLVEVRRWSDMPAELPLFETLFVFENYPVERAGGDASGRIELRDIHDRGRTNYPLCAVAIPGPELRLALQYDSFRVEAAMVARMLQHWRCLLDGMAADPVRPLARLEMLTEAERRRAVAEWNGTERAYPRDACIQRLFEAQAKRTPHAAAVLWGAGSLDYAELNRRANRMARHLQALGATPRELIGLHIERSPDLVVALLATLKAGCAYVPLDTSYPPERLAFMLRDCAARLVLTRGGPPPGLDAPGARFVTLEEVSDGLADLPCTDLPESAEAEQLAYVIYTSGSTGVPKGVAVPHRAVIRLVRDTDFVQLAASDRVAQASSASFDAATFEIWGALLNGGALVGVERDVTLSAPRLAAFLHDEGITAVFLTTALFNRLAADVPDAFRSVRHLLFGGEAADPHSIRRVLHAGRPERLLHVYGPTENTTFSTWHLVEEVSPDATTVPIGRAVAHSQAYVLDGQLCPVPVGVPGEIYLGGDGVAHGYLGRPDLTAERFVPDPFGPHAGDRLYRSGDIGRYREDGVIEFVGRRDDQVKIRGFRVELGEVETALAGHDSVRQAVVVHAEERLAAYVVPIPGITPEPAELRRYLARTLPEYMVPADFAVLERLPLNANGKLDRTRLPRIERTAADDAAAPRTATEEIVAGIWAKVLDLASVGISTSFFELGGHSLLAAQVFSRLREAFGIELPLRLLFDSPTVAGLSEHVETARARTFQPPTILRPVRHSGLRRLSFAQERLWFLNQLEPNNPFYNVPIAVGLKGALDIAALERSIAAVVQRHEVLRTCFPAMNGEPVLEVANAWSASLPVTDLSLLADEPRAAEAAALVAAEARRPFDLARGPVLRTRMLRLGPEDHILLFTMHHIAADGWSLGVLVKEFAPLYRAFHEGSLAPAAALPSLPIQYADFAAWQREWLSGALLDAQLTYWTRQLAEVPLALALPTDRPRPPAQSYRGGSVRFRMDPATAAALRDLSRRGASTLFMTLLAGFAALLHRYSRQDDIVIGSPIANRTRGEIEPLIGFFVNTLAMRVDLSGDPSFDDLLQRVRRIALDAYDHQDLPFERLVDELQPERDLSLNPLFQVMFALQNAPLERLDLPGISAELLESPRQTALFDLVLDMWEADGTLHGILEYNTDLFDEGTVKRMAGLLQTLLAAAAADPARQVGELAWQRPQERDALLRLGTGPRRDYPVHRTLHDLFAEQAACHGSRVAVVHRGAQTTYRELDAWANRIAHRLRRLGVQPNDPVALLDERGPGLLAAMLGTLKAGGAFVPLDPAYPAGRIAHMLADSQARVLVCRAEGAGAAAYSGPRLVLNGEDLTDEPDTALAPVSCATDLAYILYTSGSTGLPKGAMLRHDGAINHIYAEFDLLRFHPQTAFLQSAPSSSDISVWQFLAPLLIGGRTVIADRETVASPAELMHLIRSEDVTLIELVPAVMTALLDHAARLPEAERALPRLEWAMVTGEPATPALVNRWGALLPGVPLVNAYGPTEATDDICQGVLDRTLDSDRVAVPAGRPLPNLTLYVLDASLDLVPQGVPGEICVSGIGVGAGYWRDEARSRESFVPNPYAGDGRGGVLYRTGDLGRWLPDGQLECIERIDRQVKLRGFRIEPGEIEGALSAHPCVREAVVALCGEEDDKRLAAYVVPDLESAEMRAQAEILQRAQIDLWQDLHEDSYRDELLRGDATFNVIGWDSSYTGLPLPEADMREYIASTAERVRALGPGRVLEIGCGTGLLMFPLLPYAAAYTGTDLSRVAVQRLQALRDSPELRARIPGLDRAVLLNRRADDAGWMEPGAYDTVLLPSVVQYFPGIDYLLRVLDAVFGTALAAGGSVFVGDVRSLPLLEAFHASVLLHRADPSDRSATVVQRLRQRLAQEQELAIDPAFFLGLRDRYPTINTVDILPKRGAHQNEMTRFRYDVLIRTGAYPADAVLPAASLPWIDWGGTCPGEGELRRVLAEERPPVLALHRVANPRVQGALAAVDLLLRSGRGMDAGAGIDPDSLWQLAGECSYRVDISLARGDPDGAFDAVFRPLQDGVLPPIAWDAGAASKPWSQYANNPLQEKLARRMAPEFREFLKGKLPHYMVPYSFVLLPCLPLTPAGKVDRSALPLPGLSERIVDGSYVAPRSHEEHALSRIWAEVLGLERVGIQNNFFELGGHSLKATQVTSRIQRDLGAQIALRDLFDHPTIAELAPRLNAHARSRPASIPVVPDAADYPLSHAQRRMWVLWQMDGASIAYNMPLALLLEGALDRVAFQEAYARLVSRHEALRTSFVIVDGQPRQLVLPGRGDPMRLLDLSGQADPDAAARALALEDAAAPFDLTHSPVRASLLRLAAQRHVLLLTMHHIVSDAWSQEVLVREFVQLYQAVLGRSGEALPPLPLQYRDYACWEADYLRGEAAALHRAYWHGKLAGHLPVLDMPADLPRPPVRTYRGHTLGIGVDADRTAALSALGRGHNASLFMVLVAAVKVLLHRYTGQEDLLVGFPIAGRNHAGPELEGQVGLYVNTLPLRDRVQAEAPFGRLVDAVKATAAEAYEHQAYPFDRLVDELDVVRDVSRSPMFDVAVVMQNAGSPQPGLDGLRVYPFMRGYETSKFDLSFTFEERDGALRADITYNTDLFLPARIRRMLGHFEELVAAIVEDPEVPVGQLRLMAPSERQRILAMGAPRTVPDPVPDTLVDLFERQAILTPDAIAVIVPEGSEAEGPWRPRHALSYAELNARADRLARSLRGLGVGPDVIVGLCVPRSAELIVGLLGILKAGGAYLPLDPTHPPERWRLVATDAGVAAMVAPGDLAVHFAGLPCVDPAEAAEPAGRLALERAAADHLAYVIYTSGSTGRPKGVAVTHRNAVHLFAAASPLFGFGRQDVWTLFHSCAFDFSVWEIWGALLHGGRLVVVPHSVTRSPDAFLELLQREGVTVLNQTPSAFRQLVQAEADGPARRGLALRYVVFGGEALDVRLLRPWFSRYGDAAPRLVNMYGITETTVHVTYRFLSAADLDEPGSRIGTPLPGVWLRVLDPRGELVPMGIAGELHVGGGGVARDYLGRPDLTAERFVPDPFRSGPGGRLYRSGDLARFLPDGDVEYIGRIDHQIQLRGFRVEPGEIEAVLLGHPGVREAAVLPSGEGAHMRLTGYFVPASGGQPSAVSEVRRHLAARLPGYMVPAALVAVAAFPLTPNSKLDRAALQRSSTETERQDAASAAPAAGLEGGLAAVFQRVLGIERLGLHENFFDAGANSLLLIQAHRALRGDLGLDLPVIHLFQYPTIAALARHLTLPPAAPPQVTTREAEDRTARRAASRDKRKAAAR